MGYRGRLGAEREGDSIQADNWFRAGARWGWGVSSWTGRSLSVNVHPVCPGERSEAVLGTASLVCNCVLPLGAQGPLASSAGFARSVCVRGRRGAFPSVTWP